MCADLIRKAVAILVLDVPLTHPIQGLPTLCEAYWLYFWK
jgi:hypothetical protein